MLIKENKRCKIMDRKKGYFSISAVAEMFSVHQQTIRLYEKEGLISPKRSTGNTRLFSEDDIDKLEDIIYLTHKLGVNLAGVEMIFKQQKKIKKLQSEINTLFKKMQNQLDEEGNRNKQALKEAAQELYALKAGKEKKKRKKTSKNDNNDTNDAQEYSMQHYMQK
jgi:MerR family transcriptional regulator/heat shock protein HspR